MRNFILMMILVACGLSGLPLAAQATRSYQPTTAEEMTRLQEQQQRHTQLEELRGGDDQPRPVLNAQERDEFTRLEAESPTALQVLRDLRGGVWVIYVAVPCIVVALVVLIILLIVLT